MWTIEMNKYLMHCYYLKTKMETDQTGRHEMLQMFIQEFPRFADKLDVQKLMDRKRYIIRSKKLTNAEIDDIKVHVQRELRRNSMRRSIAEENMSNRRISEIFVSDRRSSAQFMLPEDNNTNQSELIQDMETQHLLNELRNHMDTAVTEFYGTNPMLRIKLPILRASKMLNTVINLMNDIILPNYINTCDNIENMQYIIYCAVVSIIRCLKIKFISRYSNQDNYPQRSKPAWMRRLENNISKYRASLGRLTMYRNGIRTPKLCRKIARIINPVEIRNINSNILNEYIDTHTQKLSALTKRLRRYKESIERRKENISFCKNERKFYNQFRNNQAEFTEGSPTKEEVTHFWSEIWEKSTDHDDNRTWLSEEINRNINIENMNATTITLEDIREAIRKTRNWASPGPDFVQNFWFKKFTIFHQKIVNCFNDVLQNPEILPEFMTQGKTYLIPKDTNTSNPSKYRPITCLPCLYKILTSVLKNKILSHLDSNNIMTVQQKGCKRNTRGCKDNLITDAVITGQATTKSRNLSMAFIDYKKAFDSVPHSYLKKILNIYKIDKAIVKLMAYAMQRWRTTLNIITEDSVMETKTIFIRRGIFQGDSLSPLWFCMALNPLSNALNSTGWGYQIHHVADKQTISHCFYMDDLKLYGSSVEELYRMLNLTKQISDDIKMDFGIDKCKTIHLQHGKLIRTNGFEVDDNEIIEDMVNGESYKYLGFLQLKSIHHTSIKRKLHEKFKVRINKILKTFLNSRNKMKAINSFAVPLLTYSFGIIKWSPTELDELTTLIRTTMTKHRMHHRSSAIERVTISRKNGGRGVIDIINLCKTQIENLRQYFISNRNQNEIYEAICTADENYSALHLADETYIFYPNYISEAEKIMRWRSKELHGAHPHQLDMEHIDEKASNEWLRRGELFGETEGFMIAIQDRVIATKNYQKFILHQNVENDKCRKCGQSGETIEHIINGCTSLSSTSYTLRHNNVAKIIHLSLSLKYNLIEGFIPYYKYIPLAVLENETHKILWDRSIITDQTVPANRPDIVVYNKIEKKVQLIDIAIPLNNNIQSTFSKKITKYHDLAEEIKQMWGLREINVIPIIISSTGIIPHTLLRSIQHLEIPVSNIYAMQKSIILSTCNIVRRFLNHHN